VRVAIAKKIPVAGGMAGGSADAAAALVACGELWGTGLSHAELSEVAAQVGSDVAFALLGGTAVGRGRGEQLTPALVAPASYHWVLAFASGQLSTPLVYNTLDAQREGRTVPAPELSHELMGRCGPVTRYGLARRCPTTCRRRRSPCSRRCARPWRPAARRARSARWSPVPAHLPVPRPRRRARHGPGGPAFRGRRMPHGGPGGRTGLRRDRDQRGRLSPRQ